MGSPNIGRTPQSERSHWVTIPERSIKIHLFEMQDNASVLVVTPLIRKAECRGLGEGRSDLVNK